MSISLEELRISIDKIFISLEKLGIKEFDPKKDMYWYIPKENCYDPYKEPQEKELTIGQLSFDIEELKKIIEGKGNASPLSLVWLSSILRALGDEIVTESVNIKKRNLN